MLILILFAFIAGIVTILSPCILPVLPILLAGAVNSNKHKAFGIITGFVFSFSFITLFLSSLVKVIGVPGELLRILSIVTIFLLGITLLVPSFQAKSEVLFYKIASLVPTKQTNPSFIGGLILGLGLGVIWTPCVGPILASVITLAAAAEVTLTSILITIAYSVGTAIPMLIVLYTGEKILKNHPWLKKSSLVIQKAFGVVMVILSIMIAFNLDRQFQTLILTNFPQYGSGLTQIEKNKQVENELNKLQIVGRQNNLNLTTQENNANKEFNYSNLLLTAPQVSPEIIPGGDWYNSQPLTIKSLKGKVILVDFWTYTCINCIRTLPYLKAWNDKYKDKGLVIIGVHTPEFEFEKESKNVAQAIKDFKIDYPVVQDNNYATWNAYSNQYWPAKYFIDKNGMIRGVHFGEGEYDQSEQLIQDLLKEAGDDVSQTPINNSSYDINAKTPETYLGYGRIENFASPENMNLDNPQTYSIPQNLPTDYFGLQGLWTIEKEKALPQKGAQLKLHFNAQKVHLVMRSSSQTKVKVYLDGNLISNDHAGEDVKNGVVTINEDRLYTLVNLSSPGDHTITLEFMGDETEVYAFTFS